MKKAKRIGIFSVLLAALLAFSLLFGACGDGSGDVPKDEDDKIPGQVGDDGNSPSQDDGKEDQKDPTPGDGDTTPGGDDTTPDDEKNPPPTGGDNEEDVEGLVPQVATPIPHTDQKLQVVVWDAVPNAVGYIVTVDGEARPMQTETSLSLPDGRYTVTVQAIGAQGYLDSPVSKELKVIFGWV